MAFTKEHWKEPRNTISNDLKNNDFAYISHGAKQFTDLLKLINKPVNELSNKSFLDFGCGTGRINRLSTYVFKESFGYDPVTECIDEAIKELELTNREVSLIDSSKLIQTNTFEDIPKKYFDYISSMNVFEHLTKPIAIKTMDEVIYCLNEDGKAFVWLHKTNNKDLINKYKLDLAQDGMNIAIYSFVFKRNELGV